ncbi:MAG: hypothetical protein P8M68_04010 [Aquiluna sp.]|nr:hypothetical protein [Aquiluna sp.]
MRKIFAAFAMLSATLLLSGCSVFYPNWGATALPEEPAIVNEESAEPTPSETADEPTKETESPEPELQETAEPEVIQQQVAVTILIAEAFLDTQMLEVVAQIPDLTEAGGTCTLRFIGGSTEESKVVQAQASSDYTQCFPIEIPLTELPSGSGIVTVTYESEFHIGTSAASSVVIP